MSRTLTLLILLAIIVTGFLFIRYSSKGHEFLPKERVQPNHAATFPTDFSDWREFSSKGENFKISFPGLPQHATDKIPDPKTGEPRKYDTYVAADNEGPALIVSVITFPKNISDSLELEETLKSVVNEMLQRNRDNQLKSMELNQFRGFKALDFSLSNGELLVMGKVFAHQNKLYVLSMIGQQDTFNRSVLDFFINSFQFLDNGMPAKNEKSP